MVLTPNWDGMITGDKFNAVVRTIILDETEEGFHSVYTMDTSHKWIRLEGRLPMHADHFVCLGLECIVAGEKFQARIGPDTRVHVVPPTTTASLRQVVELCCGIGAWSTSAIELQMKIIAGVDQNERWEALFRQLHPDAKFVHGDIASNEVVSTLLDAGAAHSVVLAGVSCQPHSRAGDKRGMSDERSASLPRALECAWLIQSHCVILECVPEVKGDKEFQQVLQQACREGGFVMEQIVLHLQDVWCTRRDRWFCVMLANPLGRIDLHDLPSTSMHAKVSDIMPYLRNWPSHEISQITLNLYELCKFYDFAAGGIDRLYLDMSKKLPTTLHSLGNQMYPCACGCRLALSLERMAAKGLYGILIPMDECFVHENMPRRACRYPHPAEIYLLNGGLPGTHFLDNMRLALAGIGQCVSPIQGIWILAQVLRHCESFVGKTSVDPVVSLEAYLHKVIQQRDEMWPQAETLVPDVAVSHDIHVKWMHVSGFVVVSVDPRMSVRQLIHAECTLVQLDASELRVTDEQGNPLAWDVTLGLCKCIVLEHPVFQVQTEFTDQMVVDTCMTCPCADWDPVLVSPTLPFDVSEQADENRPHPLTTMTMDALIKKECPRIANDAEGLALMAQTMTVEDRKRILHTQDHAWADDEIRRSLARITRDAPKNQNVVMWDPVVMTGLAWNQDIDRMKHFVSSLPPKVTVITAVAFDEHWYPLMWRCDENGAWMFTLHSGFNEHPVLSSLHEVFCEAKQCTCHPCTHTKPSFGLNSHCGAMVVSYLEHLVWGTPLPSTLAELSLYHQHLRSSFVLSLESVCPCPWIWGRGENSWRAKLEMLLHSHGVALGEVPSRVRLVVDKLSEATVIKAVSSQQPWKDLKWHANACTPPLQLIQPNELQQAIEKKVSEHGDVGRRGQKKGGKGKGKGKSKAQALSLDPSGLRVEAGIFQSGTDTPLGQIDPQQLGHDVSGIVLMTMHTAAPYLKSGKQLTTGALGLVLVDCVPSQVQTVLISEQVKFPAKCLANEEPLLIEGVLFQLGAIPVRRTPPQAKCSLVAMDSCVTRVLVFRDQVEGSWDQFREHPMQYIFNKVPIVRPCNDPDCDMTCESWHSADRCQMDDPLMEVWHRQWLSFSFAVVQPDKADCFSVHLRLPTCLQCQVQHYSGVGGLYLEPRQVDGRGPSEVFQVIWLPKTTFEELTRIKQSTPGIIGLARLSHKMGVRCKSQDASSIHAILKPGGAFLPAGRKLHYVIGPVPFGTLKSSIADALKSISWVARPLQPVSSKLADGVMWKVQSIVPPPVNVLCADCGELVISKLDGPTEEPLPMPSVVASQQTIQLCSNGKGHVDPLQQNDPWASSIKKPVAAPMVSAPCPIEALQQKVLDTVLAKLPKEAMEVDSDPAYQSRVELLERKVNELHENQCHMQAAVAEQSKNQGHQIQQLQQQGQRMEMVVADNVAKLGTFQTQFQKQLESQQHSLDNLFQQQMDRIEDLFAKKARKE